MKRTEDVTHRERHHVHDFANQVSVKAPVCGMAVDPEKTVHHAAHAGVTYHFCSADCREQVHGRSGALSRVVDACA